MPVIEIESLEKTFKMGGETIKALDNISLTIKDGEFVALVGPSGSGKTTLLNIIGGLEPPTKGKIVVDGQDITALNDQRISQYRAANIGYVFQTFNLLARYTVLNNVMVPGALLGHGKVVRKKAAQEALEAVGLSEKLHYLPTNLSGGERQRVAIARAIMHNPKILLADEPTGNLDEKNAEKVMDLLEKVSVGQKRTLILVTHNSELAKRADRVIELHSGKLVKGA